MKFKRGKTSSEFELSEDLKFCIKQRKKPAMAPKKIKKKNVKFSQRQSQVSGKEHTFVYIHNCLICFVMRLLLCFNKL